MPKKKTVGKKTKVMKTDSSKTSKKLFENDEGFKKLCDDLSNDKYKEKSLNLKSHFLNDEKVKKVSGAISKNIKINDLILTLNKNITHNGLLHVVSNINKKITKLNLRDCACGDEAEKNAHLQEDSLKVLETIAQRFKNKEILVNDLDLSYNLFSSNDCVNAIVKIIESAPCLTHMKIGGNNLKKEQLEKILNAFDKSESLIELRIKNNAGQASGAFHNDIVGIRERAFQSLVKGMAKNPEKKVIYLPEAKEEEEKLKAHQKKHQDKNKGEKDKVTIVDYSQLTELQSEAEKKAKQLKGKIHALTTDLEKFSKSSSQNSSNSSNSDSSRSSSQSSSSSSEDSSSDSLEKSNRKKPTNNVQQPIEINFEEHHSKSDDENDEPINLKPNNHKSRRVINSSDDESHLNNNNVISLTQTNQTTNTTNNINADQEKNNLEKSKKHQLDLSENTNSDESPERTNKRQKLSNKNPTAKNYNLGSPSFFKKVLTQKPKPENITHKDTTKFPEPRSRDKSKEKRNEIGRKAENAAYRYIINDYKERYTGGEWEEDTELGFKFTNALKKKHNHPDKPIDTSIKYSIEVMWFNKKVKDKPNLDASCEYDIDVRKKKTYSDSKTEEKTQLIEVKGTENSTKTEAKFSKNQLKTLLQNKDDYKVYRLYGIGGNLEKPTYSEIQKIKKLHEHISISQEVLESIPYLKLKL